jgi:hypothetical protein
MGDIENDFVFHAAPGLKLVLKIGQKLFELLTGLPGQQNVFAVNPVD